MTVIDSESGPVTGAVVLGLWSEGDNETAECTTDKLGTCELEIGPIRKRVSDVIFEITNLKHDSLVYLPEFDLGNPDDQPPTVTIRKP